jgi:MFS family permease
MAETTAGWRDNPLQWVVTEARLGQHKVEEAVGGPARTKVVVLLACVLGLDSADKGATGSLAAQLEAAFHIGNVKLGLLIAVSSLVGAVATLPMGVLADRTRRVRLLALVVLIWSIAEAASGLAVSYVMLLLIRVGLGLVTAAAGPLIASLIGDLFPPRQRGRIYGFVITGELIGAGIGLVVAGDIASIATWRAGYAVLAIPSLVLAWYLWRRLPEPARGGQSYLQEGAEHIPSIDEVKAHPERFPDPAEINDAHREAGADDDGPENEVLAEVRQYGIKPHRETIIEGDPAKLGIIDAVRWVLRVRTNVALIVASALGYFFLGGVRSFAVIFVRGWYGISQASASSLVLVVGIGAIVGAVVLARVTDAWIHRGRFDARMVSGAGGYIAAAVVFIPALFVRSLAVGLPLIVLAAFFLAGANPPVDAARLDVVPSRMWGRAEAIRTFLRQILEAFAPLLFGVVATALGANGVRGGFGAGVNNKHVHVSLAEATGLDHSFLIMLLPLAGAGVLLVLTRHRYGRDVASAGVTEEKTVEAQRHQVGTEGRLADRPR